MNTIHSSSLAYYPVAYYKPQTGRIDGNISSTIDASNKASGEQVSEFNTRPSSTEQIKTALTEVGLSNNIVSNLPNNTRAQQALNAYNQNHNQAAQRRLAEIISGIDVYA